jgi:hypothetical protein
MQLHDPYAGTTPSQRLAAAARSLRQERMTAGAKAVPVSCPLQRVLPKLPPFDFGKWLQRQAALNPLPSEPLPITPEITVKEIQRACARFYHVTVSDINGPQRTAGICMPRHVAIFLAKKLTSHSFHEIGRRCGGRDHTTTINSVKKITQLLETDEGLRSIIGEIAASVGGSIA